MLKDRMPAEDVPVEETIAAPEPASESATVSLAAPPVGKPDAEKPQILDEVVIEEVSIDAMCGVY